MRDTVIVHAFFVPQNEEIMDIPEHPTRQGMLKPNSL